MDVLSGYARAELEARNSRFLGEAIPVASQAEARGALREQKDKYPDATHVVHAFAVGSNAEVLGMSDDGEPAGTAGRPVLDAVRGRKCTGILLTVTRWFGGTLLGTGGLARAYGDCARAVLAAADFHPLRAERAFRFFAAYDQHEAAKRHLHLIGASGVTERFDTAVRLEGYVSAERAAGLASFVTELTKGASVLELGEVRHR